MNNKKVYLYTLDNVLIKVFKTTDECASYIGCDREYIYHNLKYCNKIRIRGDWYKLSRVLIRG